MSTVDSLARLSDADLLSEVARRALHEREATAHLIAALAELDARRLYLSEGCSSLFTYCTQVLRLSEHAAYGRIEAARAARRFPVILERLADGSVTLTAVGLLVPHLTAENHQELLASARHRSKRDIEQLVARLRPKPDVAPSVRKVPTPKPDISATPRVGDLPGPAEPPPAPPIPLPVPKPAVVSPLAPERYKMQFTVSRQTHDKLRQAQDLLRHTIPNGDPAAIFDRALTVLLEDLSRAKLAAATRPRPARVLTAGSRHIPAAVRREVWARDGAQCAFVGSKGRCAETGFLEFHHVVPYAEGGEATVQNIELRCRAHNAYESARHFGPLFVREVGSVFGIPSTRSGPSSEIAYFLNYGGNEGAHVLST